MSNNETPKFIPLSKWNDYFTFPSAGALRQYRFYNTDNFNSVVRAIGKRLYIDVAAFENWVQINKVGA